MSKRIFDIPVTFKFTCTFQVRAANLAEAEDAIGFGCSSAWTTRSLWVIRGGWWNPAKCLLKMGWPFLADDKVSQTHGEDGAQSPRDLPPLAP